MTSGSNASVSYIVNVGGSFSQTGGTFTSGNASSPSTVVFTGGSSSSVTFSTSGGTFTNTNINWRIRERQDGSKQHKLRVWLVGERQPHDDRQRHVSDQPGLVDGQQRRLVVCAPVRPLFSTTPADLYGPIDNTHVYWPNGVPHVILANTEGVQLNATRTIGKLTADANTSLEIGSGDFTLVVSGELLVQRGQDPYACWSLELAEPLRLWRGAYPARSHSQQRAGIRFQIMGNWLNEGGTYNSNGQRAAFRRLKHADHQLDQRH